MARSITFSDFANESISKLPCDAVLLKALFHHLEDAADNPDRFTEQGVYPVPSHRRMLNAELFDLARKSWHFTIVLAVTDELLEVLVVRYAQYELPPGIEHG